MIHVLLTLIFCALAFNIYLSYVNHKELIKWFNVIYNKEDSIEKGIEDVLCGADFDEIGELEEEVWQYEGKYLTDMSTNELLEALNDKDISHLPELLQAIKDELKER